jgi:pimeloyl-ACP methyl ester carboxylesterase
MRILRRLLLVLLALVLAATAASFVYDAVTSDANVPVQQLWHGKFVDGTAYREWGTRGPAIVLVGGFLEPTFVWDKVAPLLAIGYRVYALDLDGFGYTKRQGPWTLGHWGDQVQQFIQALHLGKPIVVGHSLGAAVAVEVARRGDAAAAVLVDGDALAGGGPPRFLRAALVHTPFFTTLYRVLRGSNWAVKRMLEQAYGPAHPKLDSAELHRWTDPFRSKDALKALQGIAENGIAGFTRAELRQIHVRALVIWGAADSVDAVSAGRQTAADLHARFVEVPKAGHISMFAGPRQIALAISGLR